MNIAGYINNLFKKLQNEFLFAFENQSYLHQQKALILFITEVIMLIIFAVSLLFHDSSLRMQSELQFNVDIFLLVAILVSLSFLFTGRYKTSTVILLVAVLFGWSIGFFYNADEYLRTGNSSYLFLVFGIIVLEGLLGKKRFLTIVTALFVFLNIYFYMKSFSNSSEHIQNEIFKNTINISVSLFLIYVVLFLYSVITEKALRTAEKELFVNRELNRNLENKVLKRTEEIESAYDELENMNRNLLAMNHDLEKAHDTIRNDIKMAQNVQMRFLPAEPPESGIWDVAFEFQPLSGVSGDIFDFYEFNGKLDGIMLCDVSGHGVSSGLLTILAKSIFFKSFSDNLKHGIEKVVNTANKYLIEEFYKTRNYLTGVFMSLSDSRIEYVNAGHPDIIRRDAVTGESSVIEYKDFHKGLFLGMKEMDEPYRKLKIDIKANDVILMFSDALVETRDLQNCQYGYARIQASLDNCSSEMSAEEILRSVLHDFYYETNGKIRDDLTFIVLRKK
ncbi:MAG: serine/threonine-protein phosphatase [Spirochaetes bacterium]|nr:serine/threonine-protein phosphatase [Spirochaetota bacterium]